MMKSYFRRRSFYGDWRYIEPKWHLAKPEMVVGPYNDYTALCGYTIRNRGDLMTSSVQRPKPTATVCSKCLKQDSMVSAAPGS